MKFAICQELFENWDWERQCAFSAELGYTGLELAPFTLAPRITDVSAEQRQSLRTTAEQHGVQIIGLHWLLAKTEGFYLTTPDADVRRRTSEYLGELARLCRDLGGSIMVLGSPQQRNLLPGVSHDDALRFAADVIREAVPTFEACGITLAVEPLGPQEGDFLRTAELGVQLIKLVNSSRCRLHLDVKAMSTESQPVPQIIREHAEWMVHFHANDPNRRGPGMGAMDFVPILQTLKEIPYAGWVSVEVFDYEPGVEALARDSIRYLQDCLRRLA